MAVIIKMEWIKKHRLFRCDDAWPPDCIFLIFYYFMACLLN